MTTEKDMVAFIGKQANKVTIIQNKTEETKLKGYSKFRFFTKEIQFNSMSDSVSGKGGMLHENNRSKT